MPPLIFRKGLDLKREVAHALADSYHSALVAEIKANDFIYRSGDLTIHLAREFGFCYGVDRAVDYAYQTRKRFPDRRVFLTGEDVGKYGGCFAVSMGLLDEFGPERIRDTPLSESAFVGAGIGAAIGGMRPIVEIMTVNFSLLALDQILNNAATFLHMSGGQCNVPLVIRMVTGGGRQVAAQHSHSLEGWYAHIPGLRILTPATVADARARLPPADRKSPA